MSRTEGRVTTGCLECGGNTDTLNVIRTKAWVSLSHSQTKQAKPAYHYKLIPRCPPISPQMRLLLAQDSSGASQRCFVVGSPGTQPGIYNMGNDDSCQRKTDQINLESFISMLTFFMSLASSSCFFRSCSRYLCMHPERVTTRRIPGMTINYACMQ